MPGKPNQELLAEYDVYQVGRVEIHVRRDTVMTGPAVEIGLAGVWKFRWLTVSGVGSLSTCAL